MLTPTASQRHIASIIDALLQSHCFSSKVRLLDMGCGDAHLLAHLAQSLPVQHPRRTFEFYGFEVGDVGWHDERYLAATLAFLTGEAPGYRWNDRIAMPGASDKWPYPDAAFDIVLSNQVLEHVQDHALVFREIQRCLAPGGMSCHLFPLHEQVFEFHAHMPLVHWVSDSSARRALMLFFARLGFRRRYELSKSLHGWKTLPEFATIYADILGRMTNYKSASQITELARNARFQVDFAYTKDFYLSKLRSLLKRPSNGYAAPTWIDKAAFPVLKRLASVTLVLR